MKYNIPSSMYYQFHKGASGPLHICKKNMLKLCLEVMLVLFLHPFSLCFNLSSLNKVGERNRREIVFNVNRHKFS